MQLMSELTPMRLYSSKRKVYIPFDPNNKKKGANIKLLTRDLDTSIDMTRLPYVHNPKLFYSYYMARNAMAYIDSKGIIDYDAEDEEEAINEAVLHKVPKNNVVIDCEGTQSDRELLVKYFNNKDIKDLFRRLGQKDRTWNLTVYGFNGIGQLAKAVNGEAILQYGELAVNSYNTKDEIFVVNRSSFYEISKQELDYKAYCMNALITWAVMNCYTRCHRTLANQIGCSLSGQAKLIKDAKLKEHKKISDDLTMAFAIDALYAEEGMAGIRRLVRTGDTSVLVKYHVDGIHDTVKKYAALGIKKLTEEVKPQIIAEMPLLESTPLQESDGSHRDCVIVYKAMNKQEQGYLGDDYVNIPEGRVIYRHVIRDKGIFNIKGFIEVLGDYSTPQATGDAGAVIIGVHPRHRREGIADELVNTMLKEIRKEHKTISNLVWRADINNKASQKLAEKHGFVLCRSAGGRNLYRYEFVHNKDYDGLDPKILDPEALAKYYTSKWTTTDYIIEPKHKAKVRDISEIAKSKKGNSYDAALLCSAYLSRMGLFNLIRAVAIVDNSTDTVVGSFFYNIFTYNEVYYYLADIASEKHVKFEGEVYIDSREHSDIDKASAVVMFGYIDKKVIPVSSDMYSYVKSMYEAKASYVDSNFFYYAKYDKGKPIYPNVAPLDLSYLDESTSIYPEHSISALKPIEKRKIAHIPVPRTVILGESGNAIETAGYINHRDYMMSDNSIYFFNEEDILNEANSSYDTRIRKYIYKERLKTNKDLLGQYNKAKEKNPNIKKAYLKLSMYNQLNIFTDLSYYNGLFLSKLTMIKDKAVNFYWDFMNRLLEDSEEMRSIYRKCTIFIPVTKAAWKVKSDEDVFDYRVNINPISVIFRLLKSKPEELKAKLGNKSIMFMGNTGYFTVDFNELEYKNISRLKTFIKRLLNNEDIDEKEDEGGYDSLETDTDTTAAITMNIVTKMEKNTGISIDNVSAVIEDDKEAITRKLISDIPTMRIREYKIPILDKHYDRQGNATDKSTVGIAIVGSSDTEIIDTLYDNNMMIKDNNAIRNIVIE